MKSYDNSVWRDKYKTLKEYYKKSFDEQYYGISKEEYEIDPDETIDQINKYTPKEIEVETVKCALSFPYFATKYVKILHPIKGLSPFVLYKYQREVVEEYEKHRFNIIKKFRQGGLTTVTEIWGLWRCLFKLDEQILFMSKTDREAVAASEIVNTAMKYLPDWMQSDDGKWNDHHKQFDKSGCSMRFITPEGSRGLAMTYLILDEAAFIDGMDKHWKAMYPTISTGGNVIVISTVNGTGNWYEETYHAAKEGKNPFNVIDLGYTRHPGYNNPQWAKEQKAQLGDKGWKQEVLGDFLSSGETYIPSDIISELFNLTKKNYPRRTKFKQWANPVFNLVQEDEWQQEGALWIWEEQKEDHDYIISVDSAEGVGEEGDNSCIQVIDQSTLEQVCEFYSNSIKVFQFAKMVSDLGVYYNHALVVVENMGPGGAVLSHLQHDFNYEPLFYDSKKNGKNQTPGIKISSTNRPMFLEALQHRIVGKTMRINSRRFVNELNTFIYNPKTRKAEARKGKHDDAIMALCLAVYVRDIIFRDVPMGAELKNSESPFNQAIYDEIRREIMEEHDLDMINIQKNRKIDLLDLDEESNLGVAFNVRRRHSKLLEEFGF